MSNQSGPQQLVESNIYEVVYTTSEICTNKPSSHFFTFKLKLGNLLELCTIALSWTFLSYP